jgi:hypothetical protein
MRTLPFLFILQRIGLALAFSHDLSTFHKIPSRRHCTTDLVLNEKSIKSSNRDDELDRSRSIARYMGSNTDTRRRFLMDVIGLCSLTGIVTTFPEITHAKSYSENARNLERINAGDYSGGAVYSNNPPTDAGKKRRAMVGCKTPVAREEASVVSLTGKKISESECNSMVMSGETEFMLTALRNLDCPTCPYGIAPSR